MNLCEGYTLAKKATFADGVGGSFLQKPASSLQTILLTHLRFVK